MNIPARVGNMPSEAFPMRLQFVYGHTVFPIASRLFDRGS